MTSMDRTIYRHVKRSYTTKELIEAYTPTKEECSFVETMTRSGQYQLNLMLWLKLFPYLDYFPGARHRINSGKTYAKQYMHKQHFVSL